MLTACKPRVDPVGLATRTGPSSSSFWASATSTSQPLRSTVSCTKQGSIFVTFTAGGPMRRPLCHVRAPYSVTSYRRRQSPAGHVTRGANHSLWSGCSNAHSIGCGSIGLNSSRAMARCERFKGLRAPRRYPAQPRGPDAGRSEPRRDGRPGPDPVSSRWCRSAYRDLAGPGSTHRLAVSGIAAGNARIT